jgi:hypothetical protein
MKNKEDLPILPVCTVKGEVMNLLSNNASLWL